MIFLIRDCNGKVKAEYLPDVLHYRYIAFEDDGYKRKKSIELDT